MVDFKAIHDSCTNYFSPLKTPFKDIDNEPHKLRDGGMVALKVISYFTVIIPAVMGILYKVSSDRLKDRVSDSPPEGSEDLTGGVQRAATQAAVVPKGNRPPPPTSPAPRIPESKVEIPKEKEKLYPFPDAEQAPRAAQADVKKAALDPAKIPDERKRTLKSSVGNIREHVKRIISAERGIAKNVDIENRKALIQEEVKQIIKNVKSIEGYENSDIQAKELIEIYKEIDKLIPDDTPSQKTDAFYNKTEALLKEALAELNKSE